MSIDDELVAFLQEQIREHDSTDKERNIEIIRYNYGFGEAELPTYRDAARRFRGIGTRERVRQIVDHFFRRPVKAVDMPSVEAFRKLLESRDYWHRSELEKAVENAHLVRGKFSIRGLFKLMLYLEIEHEFRIYTARLKLVPRTSTSNSTEFFVIRASEIERVRKLYNAALRLPGRYGIANLNYLSNESGFSTYKTLIENLVENVPGSWTRHKRDALWYTIENRANRLTTLSIRVFSVVERCQVDRLSTAYRNGLLRRSYEHEFPPTGLITEYLRTSGNFHRIGDTVSFKGEVSQPSRIDFDVFAILSRNGPVTYAELRKHLISKGHSLASIQHAVFHSPIVHKNKEMGQRNNTYELVGPPRSSDLEM